MAVDEPMAAQIGRDVLASGGSAADAAVAAYFALAVTLPSTAGLGGGGVCLVNDRQDKTVEAIMFLPLARPGGQVGLPLNVRGMALLQARHGKAHWSALLGPAQRLAQQGMPVSRALARELATAADKLRADPILAQIYLGADGQPLREGDNLVQLDLGSMLSQIRAGGPGSFYGGPAAARMLDAAQSAGLPLTSEDLQASLPTVANPVIVDLGGPNLYFTPPPASGGLETAELLGLLTQTRSWRDADTAERPHLFAEASMRSFADRSHWLKPDGGSATPPDQILDGSHLSDLMAGYASDKATPAASLNPPPLPPHTENPWSASIVTADKDGDAVACNVTLNDLFGSGKMLPGTGVVLAAAPNQTGQDPNNLGAMMYTSRAGGSFFYAAAASGGVTAPTALAQVFLASVEDKQPLATAIAVHRIHHNGLPDVVFYEPGTDADAAPGLDPAWASGSAGQHSRPRPGHLVPALVQGSGCRLSSRGRSPRRRQRTGASAGSEIDRWSSKSPGGQPYRRSSPWRFWPPRMFGRRRASASCISRSGSPTVPRRRPCWRLLPGP